MSVPQIRQPGLAKKAQQTAREPTHLPATNAAPRRRTAVRALRGLMPLPLSMLAAFWRVCVLLMLKLRACCSSTT